MTEASSSAPPGSPPAERLVVFHVHTAASFDSLTTPAALVRLCEARDVRTICVTDHDTIRGSIAVRDVARDSGLQVVIGAEYATELGDVIGLFLNEEVRVRDALGVIAAIRAQGGIAILPHPFQAHPDLAELHEAVDAIEVFNGRCSFEQNRRAFALAKRLSMPMLAGSDAHFPWELSNATMAFVNTEPLTPSDFLMRPRRWNGRNSSATLVRMSQGVKGMKRRSSRLALRASLATLKHAALAALGRGKRYAVVGEWSPMSASSPQFEV